MRLRILALLFLLNACNEPKVASDGYTFEKQDYEKTELSIKVVTHDNLSQLQQAAKLKGVKTYTDVQAFAILKSDLCIIHIVNPSNVYAPEWLGHEVTHCMYGQFHR